MSKAKTGDRIEITLSRSFIGRNQDVRNTLRALGLNKIGDSRSFTASPALLGMVRRVEQIVQVTVSK